MGSFGAGRLGSIVRIGFVRRSQIGFVRNGGPCFEASGGVSTVSPRAIRTTRRMCANWVCSARENWVRSARIGQGIPSVIGFGGVGDPRRARLRRTNCGELGSFGAGRLGSFGAIGLASLVRIGCVQRVDLMKPQNQIANEPRLASGYLGAHQDCSLLKVYDIPSISIRTRQYTATDMIDTKC